MSFLSSTQLLGCRQLPLLKFPKELTGRRSPLTPCKSKFLTFFPEKFSKRPRFFWFESLRPFHYVTDVFVIISKRRNKTRISCMVKLLIVHNMVIITYCMLADSWKQICCYKYCIHNGRFLINFIVIWLSNTLQNRLLHLIT